MKKTEDPWDSASKLSSAKKTRYFARAYKGLGLDNMASFDRIQVVMNWLKIRNLNINGSYTCSL